MSRTAQHCTRYVAVTVVAWALAIHFKPLTLVPGQPLACAHVVAVGATVATIA